MGRLQHSRSGTGFAPFLDRVLISIFLFDHSCPEHIEEVAMPFHPVGTRVSGNIPKAGRRIAPMLMLCVMATVGLTLSSFAQMIQPPARPVKPLLQQAANPLSDANDQMLTRERNMQRRHFNAANAERLKELMEATEMLQTMAISLEAEVDKSGDVSQNTIHKAETIEKLAHVVKERMKLTVAPN
jgi:hypothetical protein